MIYPLFGLGNQARSVNVSAQQKLNVYFEPRPDGDKNAMVAYGTATLDLFATVAGQPWRGLHVANGRLFGVQQNALYEISTTGVVSFIGNVLTSTGRVSITDNGLQLMSADGFGYIYTFATGLLVQITAAGYPTQTTDVTFQDGYFIVPSINGQFYISGLYDGLTWDATDFASAESNPDALQRVFATNGELVLFGTRTAEFWGNNGGAQFPYTNLRGSTSQWTLAAPWTLVDYDTSVMGLFTNPQNGLVVGVLNGYQVQRVSNPDIEGVLATLDLSTASALSYMANGHQFYQLNFSTRSFLYDGLTGQWSDLEGYGLPRHRAQFSHYWPGVGVVMTDYANGNLYLMNPTGTDDNGQPVIRRIRGRHLFNESEYVSVNALVLDMQRGSDSTVTDPQVMLRVSKDGGYTWVMERWTSIGKVGEYAIPRAKFRRLGSARDWVFEVTVSDPVPFAIVNAYADAS